jgi:hypothetical protein
MTTMLSCCRGALAAAAFALVLGCGGSLPEPADPGKGEDAVRAAFTSWKNGETPKDLHQRQPPIYLNDPEWAGGAKLLNFEIVEPLTPSGRQLRCTVKLSLQDAKTGAKSEKRVGYQVETNPVCVIAREEL